MNGQKQIGIDRIVLKAIDIQQVNVGLMRQSFLIRENGEYFRIMIDGAGEGQIKVSYIKVKSTEGITLKINELDIGVKKVNNQLIPYEYLDATLPSLLDDKGLNVNNIQDVTSFIKSLEILEQELQELGFGQVDLKKAQIEELELNINIAIAREFGEYERPLKYIKGLLPRTLKKEQEYRNRVTGDYTGFKCFNNSISFKIYNKRAQVQEEHNHDIGEELLRLEYRLLSGEKVKDLLGHNQVEELIKDFKQIERAFRVRLEKDFINKLEKDIQDQLKNTIKKLKDYKTKSGKSAIDEFIKNEELLDIELILGALKKTEHKSNYSRECKKAIKSAQGVKRTKLFGNIALLNELLEKMGYNKIEIETSKNVKKLLEKHY